MRILFCNFEYPPLGGGGGIVNCALARELARRHEVTVLTSRAFGLPAEEIVDDVRVIRVPVFFRRRKSSANILSLLAYVPAAIIRGLSLVRQESFDIINTHFVVPTGPVGHVLSRLGGIPNVLSIHVGDIFDSSKRMSPHRHFVLRLFVRRLVRYADKVVGQSENTIVNLHKYYKDDTPAALIPLGIEEPPRSDMTRQELGFDEQDILLVTIGRLVARKRVEQLLELLSRIDRENVKLVVVGSGPEMERLKTLATKKGVENRIYWTGFVPEATKQGILQNADIFVSTSEHEGFGLVFVEAMTYGLPVVCYDNGGQIDFLSNGRNGFIIPLNDLDAILEKCSLLISETATRERIEQANVKDVRKYFINECAMKYESLFEEIIRARNGPRITTNEN
jgi:glycosyltransferase involved in cell wall biosynthesis